MDNNSISNGFKYTFAIMLVLLVLVFWQVYFVHRPKIKELQLEHKGSISLSTIEGMSGSSDVYGAGLKFHAEQSDLLATPGYNKGFAGIRQQRSGFFGGSEPPVFYDIGNIQADRAMRSKRGYTFGAGQGQDGIVQNLEGGFGIKQENNKGVLFDKNGYAFDTSSGGPGMSFYKTGDGPNDEWRPCPSAKYRTSSDGYSCYIPEGMTDPLAITTSGLGRRDPFAEIENTVYGG